MNKDENITGNEDNENNEDDTGNENNETGYENIFLNIKEKTITAK